MVELDQKVSLAELTSHTMIAFHARRNRPTASLRKLVILTDSRSHLEGNFLLFFTNSQQILFIYLVRVSVFTNARVFVILSSRHLIYNSMNNIVCKKGFWFIMTLFQAKTISNTFLTTTLSLNKTLKTFKKYFFIILNPSIYDV